MGINTDLKVSPYYDDFDETKQFNRVLFKPAKAVQARELTQLQTILQKQVERFGSNIYKEGTIISGINLTARDDLNYVKLNDQAGFSDPTLFDEIINNETGVKTTFTVTGQTSGIQAEIVKGQNGFQTQDPNLKTFFINYRNTALDSTTSGDVKEFIQGEILDIKNSSGETVQSVTVNTGAGHAGKSFGISCEEGVIYQKGHFIFVDNQFIVVSKYTNTPGTSSVGFTVSENLINSSADTSLLDNASGFNNENAPGADRLQLVPTLVSYPTASEPTEFFALIRYVDGKPTRIRSTTEFNSITTELARRTYEESGNYVTNGLDTSLEQIGSTSYAVVSPGKAYVFGREIGNVSSKKLAISPTTTTQTKTNQYTGIGYGQYLEFDSSDAQVLHNFNLDGTRYRLIDGSGTIATCSVSNVTPGNVYGVSDADAKGRIYIYGVVTVAGKENLLPTQIGQLGSEAGLTTVIATGGFKFFDPNRARRIFDAGKSSMTSITNVNLVERRTITSTATSDGSHDVVTIAATANEFPQIDNIFAIESNAILKPALAPTIDGNGTVTIKFTNNALDDNSIIYYDAIVTNTTQDSLAEQDVFVKSTLNQGTGIANIGLPNAIQLISVTDNTGGDDPKDVTGKFRLVNNQKDTFYDLSYIKLKSGESISSARSALTINVKVLSRTTPSAGGYLTVDSYAGVTSKNLVRKFTAKDGIDYSPLNCYDFRPYATPKVGYAQQAGGAGSATTLDAVTFSNGIAIGVDSVISATHEYYLSRVDRIIVDEYSNISILKGTESENPSAPNTDDKFALTTIFVPGNVTRITGEDRIQIKDISVNNYTMKDIGKLEQKVDSMVNLVSLSLLEQDTKSLLIKGADGTDRFKNGILADSFNDLLLGEVIDPEFKASLDKSRTIVSPAVKQFPIDLTYLSGSTANQWKNVATIAVSSADGVSVISQPYATSFRNCVSNFYNYAGKAFISPPFDSGYDVIQNPAIDFEIDIAGPILDLVDNLQEIMPLTKEDVDVLDSRNFTENRRRFNEQNQRVTTSTLTSSTNSFTTGVGNFVTDINMKPYVRSKEVKIFIGGLRPSTRHYFYFQQVDIASHVYPGMISSTSDDVNDVQINGVKGAAVRTDADGTLTAVFKIPEGTFFVGENILEVSDVDTYSSIDSAKTSYARASYRAYNFNVNKSALNVNTRTVDFDTDIDITERLVRRRIAGDPIAQTFKVQSSTTNDSNIALIKEVDVFFKSKSLTTGITLEIREVSNGYPSANVVAFGRKHLRSADVFVSDTAATKTTFTFEDPVRLNVESEYCFVLLPDANSPDYLIWTSKVGGTDVTLNQAVTSDWGDGVLFTSTNDSAWKSYQDEDIKFDLKRHNFQDSTLVTNPVTEEFINLVPNSPEFLTVRDTTGQFENDELAYVVKSTAYSGSISGTTKQTLTITGSTAFTSTDYVYIESGTNKLLSKITGITTGSNTVITLETPYSGTGTTGTAYICSAGRVSHYNRNRPTSLFLNASSARQSNYFNDNAPVAITTVSLGNIYTIVSVGSDSSVWNGIGAGSTPTVGQTFLATGSGTGLAGGGTVRNNNQKIIGYNTGAFSYISTVDDENISYFQPQIYTSNSNVTSTELTLMNGASIDRPVAANANTYTINSARSIKSASNRAVTDAAEDFIIKVSMGNSGYTAASPIIDFDLSMLNVYKYDITNSAATSSNWITKEVVLKDELYADDMKVLLSAYRPPGTIVDVYTRYVYPTNVESPSDWILLTNKDTHLYSNVANTRDYRQFEYDLNSADSTNYMSFQLKLVMRHMTSGELSAAGTPNVTPDINLFPHVYDYRAIALT